MEKIIQEINKQIQDENDVKKKWLYVQLGYSAALIGISLERLYEEFKKLQEVK